MGFFKPNIKKLEDKADIDGLIKTLDYQDDPVIRCKAAQALGRLKNKRSLKPLVIALQDISPEVCKNVVEALGEIGGRNVLRVLCKYSAQADYSVRVSVNVAINNILNSMETLILISLIEDEDRCVRRNIFSKLVKTHDPTVIECISKALNNKNSNIRYDVVDALGQFGKDALMPLSKALQDSDINIRRKAIYWLKKIGIDAIASLSLALSDSDLNVRKEVVFTIESIINESIKPIREELSNADISIRQNIFISIKTVKKELIEPLYQALLDENNLVCNSAIIELMQYGDDSLEPIIDVFKRKDIILFPILENEIDFYEIEKVEQILTFILNKGDLSIRKKLILDLLQFWNTVINPIIIEHNINKDVLNNVITLLNDYNLLMFLWHSFNDEDFEISIPVGHFLTKLEIVIASLFEVISDDFSEISSGAVIALGKIGNFKSIRKLEELLQIIEDLISDWDQRKSCEPIPNYFTPSGKFRMVKSSKLNYKDKEYWNNFIQLIKKTINEIKENPMGNNLILALNSSNDEIREVAASLLESYGDIKAVLPLCQKINDKNVNVRRNVAKTLWYLGDETAVEYLCSALQDSDKFVRNTAANKLISLFNPVDHSIFCRLDSKQKKLILKNYDLISVINENKADLKYNSLFLNTIPMIEKDDYQLYRLLVVGNVEKIEDDYCVIKSIFHSEKYVSIPYILYPDIEVGDTIEISIEKYTDLDQQLINKLKNIRQEIANS
jgi:HEAT repeat protein